MIGVFYYCRFVFIISSTLCSVGYVYAVMDLNTLTRVVCCHPIPTNKCMSVISKLVEMSNWDMQLTRLCLPVCPNGSIDFNVSGIIVRIYTENLRFRI